MGQLLGVGGNGGMSGLLMSDTVVTGVHGVVGVGCAHASVILRFLLGRVLCWCVCWGEGEALGGSFLFIREVFVFS